MATKSAIFSTTPFNGVPLFTGTNIQEWSYHVRNVINGNLNGKLNCTGTFTLNASTVSSVIQLSSGSLGNNTVVMYFPLSASAATEFGAGTIFMSSRDIANYTFTLTHTSTADTDKIFAFVLIG